MTESLPFIKMHGLGNDFVVVGPEDAGRELDWPRLARETGDRHFGVGHDGLLLVERGTTAAAEFRMRMFNPDGSESEMCGNGIRCFAKYLYDVGLTHAETMRIQTGAGVQQVRLLIDGAGAEVRAVVVDMGVPVFAAERVPVLSERVVVEREPLSVDGHRFEISAVSMGNPHAVAFVEDVQSIPLERVGPLVERHPWFPRRVNFEVVSVQARDELTMRVWERGAGMTLACGSGACAVMAVAHRLGLVDDVVVIHLPGGDLSLQWDGTGSVAMTGPATYVFRGEWPMR
jgi:diaminopimelate epimerase